VANFLLNECAVRTAPVASRVDGLSKSSMWAPCRRRLPLRVDPLYWEAIDSWLEATARSMGALRWNSSTAITKCSLTMWRGETVYDVIVDVKINNASRAAIGLGP
jgi:hypothetical protein